MNAPQLRACLPYRARRRERPGGAGVEQGALRRCGAVLFATQPRPETSDTAFALDLEAELRALPVRRLQIALSLMEGHTSREVAARHRCSLRTVGEVRAYLRALARPDPT